MGVIDAPPLNIGKDKARLYSKEIKVTPKGGFTIVKPIRQEKGKNYLKVKPIDPKKFSIWHNVNGCDEFTLAITPLKSERQAKIIKREIMRHADDLIFWQGELLRVFGEVSLADVISEAKKYRRLRELIENHINSNIAKNVPYGDSCVSSIIKELHEILEELEK